MRGSHLMDQKVIQKRMLHRNQRARLINLDRQRIRGDSIMARMLQNYKGKNPRRGPDPSPLFLATQHQIAEAVQTLQNQHRGTRPRGLGLNPSFPVIKHLRQIPGTRHRQVPIRGGVLRLLRSSLGRGGRSSLLRVDTLVVLVEEASLVLARVGLLRGIPHRLRVSRFRRLFLVRGLLVLRRRCRFGHRRRLLRWRRVL